MSRRNKSGVAEIERAMHQIVRDLGRRNLGRKMERRLESLVSLGHVSVVDALAANAESGSPATVGQIAKRIDVDPSQASRMVTAFIKAGYARRVALQSDARHVQVELTEQGRKFADSIADIRRNYFASHLKRWSDEDCRDFARLLTRFAGELRSAHAERLSEESLAEQGVVVLHPAAGAKNRRKLRRVAE